MVGAQQARKDRRHLQWHQRKRDSVPTRKDHLLEVQERVLAPMEKTSGKARLRECCLNKGRVITTTLEFVLYAQTAVRFEETRPLVVDLAFEVECAGFIGHVAGSYEHAEAYPEEEGVYGEESAIIEEDAAPSDERG